MQTYAKENNVMNENIKGRRNLIGSYFGKRMILITPLLKWYLSKGMIITKIYYVLQYRPFKVYEKFKDVVIKARQKATLNPAKAVLAKTYKLLGNTFFGKTASNVYKYKQHTIVNREKAERLMNNIRFSAIDEINENTYEVMMQQRTIRENLPLIIAYFVYNYAKLNLLRYVYDFIDYYIPRSRYRPLLCDTDSYYVGLASDNGIEYIVKADKRQEFFENLETWMPIEACERHKEKWLRKKLAGLTFKQRECCETAEKLNSVTPLLFKREFRGTRAISLCSKTYYIDGQNANEFKMGAKGLSRKSNDITFNHFYHCLMSQKNCIGTNQGIMKWRRAGQAIRMCTYQKTQDVLTSFYVKRRVDRYQFFVVALFNIYAEK